MTDFLLDSFTIGCKGGPRAAKNWSRGWDILMEGKEAPKQTDGLPDYVSLNNGALLPRIKYAGVGHGLYEMFLVDEDADDGTRIIGTVEIAPERWRSYYITRAGQSDEFINGAHGRTAQDSINNLLNVPGVPRDDPWHEAKDSIYSAERRWRQIMAQKKEEQNA